MIMTNIMEARRLCKITVFPKAPSDLIERGGISYGDWLWSMTK